MPIAREVPTPKNDVLKVSRSRNLPHSPGIRAGDFIFLSGMVSIDPRTGELSHGRVAHETRQILSDIQHLLESANSPLERVVKTNVLLHSMLEFEDLNTVYREFFPSAPPARAVCGVHRSFGLTVA
jgi:2-iminobutanoate/2-iminopropanoate deaminase